jgi:hypothetical protein
MQTEEKNNYIATIHVEMHCFFSSCLLGQKLITLCMAAIVHAEAMHNFLLFFTLLIISLL